MVYWKVHPQARQSTGSNEHNDSGDSSVDTRIREVWGIGLWDPGDKEFSSPSLEVPSAAKLCRYNTYSTMR